MVNGNGNGGNGNGPTDPIEQWSETYPEKYEDRVKYFKDTYQRTADLLISLHPTRYKEWRERLPKWYVRSESGQYAFLSQCIICHKERVYPTRGAWKANFGLSTKDVSEVFPEPNMYFGEQPEYVVEKVRDRFKLKGYDLELKVDEIIAWIGSDFKVAEWVRDSIKSAQERAKTRATIRAWTLTVSLGLLTYGFSEALGLRAKVGAAVAEAKAQYVKGTVWQQIVGWIKTIKAGISAFLTAIHYDTLAAIHRIAYLASSNYRSTMNKVYREISRASEALGFGPYYLQLFIQNARTIILDVSTSFGRGYDVAQMEWLSTFDSYLKEFNARAYRYRNDPALMFYDLEQLVERPALDSKAAGSRSTFDSITKLLETTANTVKNVKTISDDLDQLVHDLPEEIRKHVEPHTKKVTEKVDDFITNSYEPNIGILNDAIVALRGKNETLRGDLSGVIGRLAKPADYLLEIEGFPDADRWEQESKVANLASRHWQRDSSLMLDSSHEIYENLESITEALEFAPPPTPLMPKEIEKPGRPAGVPAEPRETWFVGDY